jgi:hypothetical protein
MMLHHRFDLSRTVADLLHNIGYLALNVGVRFLNDREGQVRRRHDLTLLDYGLRVDKENQIQIVTLHSKLRGGSYIHHSLAHSHETVCVSASINHLIRRYAVC